MKPAQAQRLRHLHQRLPEDLSVEWLEAHGLPLYWHKGWLEQAVKTHGSLAAVAGHHGWGRKTVQKYAQRHHCYPKRAKPPPRRRYAKDKRAALRLALPDELDAALVERCALLGIGVSEGIRRALEHMLKVP